MALNEADMRAFMAAQQAEHREQVLYSFRCGLCNLAGTTITSDTRKGIALLTMESDGLLRFSWKPRHASEPEQQHIIFPGSATFTKLSECKDGIVYMLKLDSMKRFFWSQESNGPNQADRDAAIRKRVSALFLNPPAFGAPIPPEDVAVVAPVESASAAGASAIAAATATAAAAAADADTMMSDVTSISASSGGLSTIQGTDRAFTVQAHGASLHPAASSSASAPSGGDVPQPSVTPAASSPSPPAAAAASSSSSAPAASPTPAPLNSADNLLAMLTAMARQLQARQSAASETGVEDVLDADRVQAILNVDAALVDALVQYLPAGQQSPDQLRAQLRSPQMQSTMTHLTEILNGASFGQLMASMSLPVDQHTNMGVDGFIKAIQDAAKKQQDEKK